MSKSRSHRSLPIFGFLENLALVFAAMWSLGLVVLVCYVVLTEDPQDPPKQPPPREVILPDGKRGIVTEVMVNPDGTRWYKVKESEP